MNHWRIGKWEILTARWACVCYAVALFIVTHIPVPQPLADVVSLFDKVLHASVYAGLSLLANVGFGGRGRRLMLIAALVGFAALDEYTQGFVGRTPDWSDWISDSAGILLGTLIAWAVVPKQFQDAG